MVTDIHGRNQDFSPREVFLASSVTMIENLAQPKGEQQGPETITKRIKAT